MIKINTTLSQQAEFGMPETVAAVRALPVFGPKGAVSAATAGSKRRIDTTGVCGYSLIPTVVVLDDAFPGASAWSPPI